MSDLRERLTELAGALVGCEWEVPLGSQESLRQAADEIERLTRERDDLLRHNGRLTRERDEARAAAKFCWSCKHQNMWKIYRDTAATEWPWIIEN